MGILDSFSLAGRVAVITGGGGLLGPKHAEAIAEAGGIPVIWDIDGAKAEAAVAAVRPLCPAASAVTVDITDNRSVAAATERTAKNLGRIDILINNAANDPKVGGDSAWSRLESYDRELWDKDIAVGLTGAFLCAQAIGPRMATQRSGVILNIASDLSVISPDQRLYRDPALPNDRQPVKPITYSIVKHGLIGLTRYLSTYWTDRNVRVNALSPGGVQSNQPEEFVRRLTQLIPMGRMAGHDEYKAAVVFLCSDASAYMTGQNIVMDGGRTVL